MGCGVVSGVAIGMGVDGCVDVGGGSESLPRVEHSSTGQVVSIEVNVVMEVEVSKPSSAVQAQVFGSVGVRNDSSNSPSMVRRCGERMVVMACWMLNILAVLGSAAGISSSSSSILASTMRRVVSLPLSMSAWQAVLAQ